MAKKISFSCWTKAENVERQDGHIFQAQSSSQSVHRFGVILPARGFRHANKSLKQPGYPVAGGASFACFCQSNPDFYLRDQLFNTQYKTLSESIKSLSFLTPPANFLNLWLTVPESLRNGKQAIFRNRVILETF